MAEESAAVPTLRDGVEEIDEKHSDSLEADKGIPVGKDLIQIVKTTGDVGEVFYGNRPSMLALLDFRLLDP